MNIRSANQGDVSTIASFQIAMAHETENIQLDKATVNKGVKAVINDHTKGQYFVAEKEGIVVGSLLITFEWSDWRNGTIWWIQSVYVDLAHRQQGIYTLMYKHVRSIVATDKNINGIRLYAEKSNKKAQTVYEKLGMHSNHYDLFEWMKDF